MKCPRCQQENEAGAKFCEECATPLARTCSNCGRQLSATAKFCPECAHPASPAAPGPTAQRFISPESYTPKAPRRKDPHVQERARRRTQAGDRIVRGSQGVDGAAR